MRISLRSLDRVAKATSAVREPRKGFALIEVIVAMVLLAVAVSSLAALMYSVSQNGMKATGNAYRNGVLMHEVNRLEGIPYDSIAIGSSSVAVSTMPYPHTRVITVTEPVARTIKSITVVITPVNVKFKPDTVSFIRTRARTSRALCTTCPQG
ncbi:MAG TPA: prepilin-type N-terminal cleavage/methylation domain-containing protein [Gemmatimonadaceae bacterium]|nr:prepilin-type N-terminal cleavage/methylation domain-containing protein [Gemmatimonadaceae bacterium]